MQYRYTILLGLLLGMLIAAGRQSSPVHAPSTLRFTENKGQWAGYVQYIGDLAQGKLIMERNAVTMLMWDAEAAHEAHHHRTNPLIQQHAVKISFVNGASTSVVAMAPERYRRNYFLGNDPAHWATDVALYQKVVYKNVWPGIDAQWYGSGHDLKYDFRVQPGANVQAIQLRYEGVNNLRVEEGELRYETTLGAFAELEPYAYQLVNGMRRQVRCEYVLNATTGVVSLHFPDGYNTQEELIIDPTLVFSTYTGATADNWGFTATYDKDGNFYAGGITFEYRSAYSPGSGVGTYPVVGPVQSTFQGGDHDITITKFDPTGVAVSYSTYLGGTGNDSPHSLVVNSSNELYILGSTTSANYPATPGSYDVTHNGGLDIIITRLNVFGNALLASTYVGGTGNDGQNLVNTSLQYNYGDNVRGEIIVDSLSNVFIASCTNSSDFPVTPGAIKNTLTGAQDGCLLRLPPNLSALTWSTFIGGSNDDACYSLKLDAGNVLFVTGGTNSFDFPVTAGSYNTAYGGGVADGYILRIANNGSAILAGTYLGTSAYDQCYFIEIDNSNFAYVVGQTLGNYPVSNNVYVNPNTTQFIHKLNNSLTTSQFSTRFGSGANAVNISPTAFLVDDCKNIYVAGWGGNVNQSHSPQTGTTVGMPVTPDALKSTTDGSDLYFIIFDEDCSGLLYASFYGGNAPVGEHVDGGTCRFDKNGVIYTAVCSGCGGNSMFPSSPGVWSTTNNSLNCNESSLKIEFNLAGTTVELDAYPRATGCVPLTVQFQGNVSNASSFTWYFGDGNTSNTLNPAHTYTAVGTYTVMLIGTDPSSCNVSDTAYLEVWVRDDSISADFSSNLLVNCDSNKVTVSATNYPTTQYAWNMGDGTTYNTATVNHYYANPGSYVIRLIVSDTSKCNLQDTFARIVMIPAKINPAFTVSNGNGCVPLTTSFSASNVNTATYIWNFGNGSTATGSSVTNTYQQAGTYTIKLWVTDTTSCNKADSSLFTVVVIDSSANADFDFIRTFYGCDSVMVMAWSTYVGEDSQVWNFGDGSPQAFTDTVYHMYNTAGTFTLTHILTDADKICRTIDTAQIVLSLNPLYINIQIPDSSGCLPFTVNMAGTSGLVSTQYAWNFGDGATATGANVTHTYTAVGTYTVMLVATDTNACESNDTTYATITVINDFVDALFNLQVLNNCDSNLTVQFTDNSTNAVNYYWDFGDGTTSTTPDNTKQYTLPGTYTITLIVEDVTRCTPRDTFTRTVTLKPNAFVDFDVQDACQGNAVQFVNYSNPNAQFVWSFGDGTQSTQYQPLHNYNAPGNYTVTLIITDTATCNLRDTLAKSLQIFAQPLADFTIQGDSFKYMEPVFFQNNSTGYSSLWWDLGYGIQTNEISPTYAYTNIGPVEVCLFTANSNCYDTLCKTINIYYNPLIGVPNAFSPNGDGVNDVVKVEGKGIVTLLFRIFNRWGELVYEGRNQNEGWDGFYKGTLQEMDSYSYTVEAVLVNGDNKLLKGNITLLR